MALILILVVGLSFCVPLPAAEFPTIAQPAKNDGSLSLLVVGDWGRKGRLTFVDMRIQEPKGVLQIHPLQSFRRGLSSLDPFGWCAVAIGPLYYYLMAKTGEDLNIDFVISTGDNFYENGLKDVDDKAFYKSFADIYTGDSLQKKWYTVLGNHDYRGDVLAQLSPDLQRLDNRWTCMRSFIVDSEFVQFFLVDTTPFVLKYWNDPEDAHYDWRDVAPRGPYINNLLKDLDSALKESTATWKIVVGHHTIRSVSDHGDTQELVQLLLPVLKDNAVDLYINGHDHCLEHISSRDSPVQFLTSGGGSKAWRGVYTPNTDKLQFFYDGQGFMSLELSNTDAKATFYDLFGNVLHTWKTSKDPSPFI